MLCCKIMALSNRINLVRIHCLGALIARQMIYILTISASQLSIEVGLIEPAFMSREFEIACNEPGG